jgi:hypothetical protein
VEGLAQLKPRYSGVYGGLSLSFPQQSQITKADYLCGTRSSHGVAWIAGLSRRHCFNL